MDFLNCSVCMRERLTELRRRLHACPEIGFDLPQTMAVIEETLIHCSIPFSRVGKGAVVGEIGPKTEKTVLLRADCDGLPLVEETDLPFRSTNGAMHACGHDLHTTALLGAAMLLKEAESRLPHRVRLLFQPAEELLQGAADGVASGVCDGVSAAYMLHVSLGTGLPVGTVILPPEGTVAPSADYFELKVTGKGCHGADPASGRDPLAALARMLLGLEHLSAREIPSGEQAVITVGCVRGGDVHNILPDNALLKGSMRCYDELLRQRLQERIKEMAEGISLAHGVSASLSFPAGCPSLYNNPALRKAGEILFAREMSSHFYSVRASAGTAGSEDFAVISRKVPSLMIALAAGDSSFPLHHPKAVFDEGCLPYGAAALALLGASG